MAQLAARDMLEIEVQELEEKLARKKQSLELLKEDDDQTYAPQVVIIRANEFAGMDKVPAVIATL